MLIALTLTACNAYKPDTSGFTEEYKQKEQALLDEFKDKYENATTDDEKEEFAFETGFRYMNLGSYSDAIKYYKIVLKYNPIHFQALNNMAVMYEEMGETEEALKYEKQLYSKNATNTEVVRDTIRLLVENKQFEDAHGVLDTFASAEEGKKEGEFLSEQLTYIVNEEKKAKK